MYHFHHENNSHISHPVHTLGNSFQVIILNKAEIPDRTIWLLSWIPRLIRKLRKKPKKVIIPHVEFYERIATFYCKLAGIKCSSKIINTIESSDDVYGEYPIIIFGPYIIPRHNIISFFQCLLGLDLRLPTVKKVSCDSLIQKLVNEMHFATQYIHLKEEGGWNFNPLEFIFSPFNTFEKWTENYSFCKFASKYLNIHNKELGRDILSQHNYTLEQVLDGNPFYTYIQLHSNPLKISDLDIVAYAAIKEQMLLLPHSPETTKLSGITKKQVGRKGRLNIRNNDRNETPKENLPKPEFAGIRKFVERMDNIYTGDPQCNDIQEFGIGAIPLRMSLTEIKHLTDKYITGSESVTKQAERIRKLKTDISPERMNTIRTRKICVFVITTSFLFFLNFGKNPFTTFS